MTTIERPVRPVEDQLTDYIVDRLVDEAVPFSGIVLYRDGQPVRYKHEETDADHGPLVVVGPQGDRFEVEVEVFVRPLAVADLDEPAECQCVKWCAEHGTVGCHLNGIDHVHPDASTRGLGACPVHLDAARAISTLAAGPRG